jgi:hypothetical protein
VEGFVALLLIPTGSVLDVGRGRGTSLDLSASDRSWSCLISQYDVSRHVDILTLNMLSFDR